MVGRHEIRNYFVKVTFLNRFYFFSLWTNNICVFFLFLYQYNLPSGSSVQRLTLIRSTTARVKPPGRIINSAWIHFCWLKMRLVVLYYDNISWYIEETLCVNPSFVKVVLSNVALFSRIFWLLPVSQDKWLRNNVLVLCWCAWLWNILLLFRRRD